MGNAYQVSASSATGEIRASNRGSIAHFGVNLIASRFLPKTLFKLKGNARADEGWAVEVLAAATAADVLVWPQPPEHNAWPPATPLVLVGDDVRGPPDARPVALLPADTTPAQLRAAVAAVLQGLSVRDAGSGWVPASASAFDADHDPLTPRELEVFELLGKGLSNRDIGGVLGISAHTAKFHVGQILAKVGAATRAEAVSSGLRLGVIGL